MDVHQCLNYHWIFYIYIYELEIRIQLNFGPKIACKNITVNTICIITRGTVTTTTHSNCYLGDTVNSRLTMYWNHMSIVVYSQESQGSAIMHN